MRRVIKITESDLAQIVKRVIREDMEAEPEMADVPVDKVSAVQQALKAAGEPYATLLGKTGQNGDGIDGKFGQNTRAAVRQYQKDKGIKQTGNVGPVTAGKLGVQALTSGKPTQPRTTPSGYNLSQTTKAKQPRTTPSGYNLSQTTKAQADTKKVNLKYPELYKPQANPSDYLGKGGEFERSLYGGRSKEDYIKMQEFLRQFPPAKKSNMPLHVRALMDYLGGRTEPFTSKDLTREEQQFLKNVAIQNAKTGLKYNTWKSIGAGNLPTAMTSAGSEKENEKFKNTEQGSLTKPGLAGEFMYTLGEVDPPAIKVAPDKKSVTVRDNYDFNSVNLPKEQIMQNFSDALKNYFTGKGTFYSIVRNAVAFKEMSGYPGYPVNITV